MHLPSLQIVANFPSSPGTRNQQSSSSNSSEVPILLVTPTPAPLVEENLLGRFLEFLSSAARRTSWTLKLPDLKASPDAHALRSSLRAVSLAYFAHGTWDRAAQLESLRHYGDSLVRQRLALAQLPASGTRVSGSVDQTILDTEAAKNALLATVILSYFEVISASCPGGQHTPAPAWINHLLAAERILVLLGPRCLANDIFAQLFYSIRSHAVHRAAVLGYYTAFAEDEWLEAASQHVLKQSYARTVYDRLTEWILRLSRLSQSTSRRSAKETGTLHPVSGQTPKETALAFLEELEERYEIFMSRCRHLSTDDYPLIVTAAAEPSPPAFGQDTSQSSEESIGQDLPSFSDSNLIDQARYQPTSPLVDCMTTGVLAEGPASLADQHPKLHNQFSANTTAYFHTAVILLYKYCPEVATTEQGVAEERADEGPASRGRIQRSAAKWDILHNARSIVAAGRLLAPEGKSNGTAVLRMMVPFSVIWHFCQPALGRDEGMDVGETQRVRLDARQLFEQWCAREGMGGLPNIAFDFKGSEVHK